MTQESVKFCWYKSETESRIVTISWSRSSDRSTSTTASSSECYYKNESGLCDYFDWVKKEERFNLNQQQNNDADLCGNVRKCLANSN